MSMTEQFFSVDYAGRTELFQGLDIWKYERYRTLQGTYPVLFISFSDIKETTFEQAKKLLNETVVELYNQYHFLSEGALLNEREKEYSGRFRLPLRIMRSQSRFGGFPAG